MPCVKWSKELNSVEIFNSYEEISLSQRSMQSALETNARVKYGTN